MIMGEKSRLLIIPWQETSREIMPKRAKTVSSWKKTWNYVRPVLLWGIVPAVIVIGMRTEPRPTLMEVLNPLM